MPPGVLIYITNLVNDRIVGRSEDHILCGHSGYGCCREPDGAVCILSVHTLNYNNHPNAGYWISRGSKRTYVSLVDGIVTVVPVNQGRS